MSSTEVSAREQVLAELAVLAPASGDAVSLLVAVRELASFTDRVLGQLARLTALVDATGAFESAGYTSAAAFLRHGCGRSAGRAGELVAVGRELRRLETTRRTLAEGQISFDAAHVICRTTAQVSDDALAAAAEREMLAAAIAGLPGSRPAAEATRAPVGTGADSGSDDSDGHAGHEEDGRPGDWDGGQDGHGDDGQDTDTAAGQAATGQAAGSGTGGGWVMPGLDPRELRRLGEDLAYRADPDAVEERQRKRFERRYLAFGLTLDDVGTISGACSDTLSIEIIKTAVEAFSPPGGSGDTRTAGQRRMDGLTAACQAALDSGRAGMRHGALPHVTVLLDDQTTTSQPSDPEGTAADSRPGPARTGHGALLTARQILTLACRAEISLIRWRKGLPLDVGRRYRTETPAQRRALAARDRGCRFPGCGLPAAWCTAHHIRPWKRGGATRLPNMVLLCFVHHHYFVHLLGWVLTGSADATLHFTHPGGSLTLDSRLPASPAGRSP